MEIVWKVTREQANQILAILGREQYQKVASLIGSLVAQAQISQKKPEVTNGRTN